MTTPTPSKTPSFWAIGKTARTFLVFLVPMAIPYTSPKLRAFRITPTPWDSAETEAEAVTEETPPAPPPVLATGEATLRASENKGGITHALPAEADREPVPVEVEQTAKQKVAIEDPSGHSLDAFYASLIQTSRKEEGAITRVLHYGDSVITSDFVSGTMRRRFQARFGDAGHGFILIANPWEWYFHNDVGHTASDGWNANRIVGPLTRDGMYGLGGVSFHTSASATAWFATADRGTFGRSVSRFDIYYLEQPGGGDVQVSVPGSAPERFPTRGPTKVSRVHSVPVPDGKASMTLQAWGNGDVRLFGVVLEREVAGVAYDALGANGARARLLDQIDEAHWTEQMDLRNPALIVLQYGTNESEDAFNGPEYERTLGSVLDKVRTAAPRASVIVASAIDRAERGPGGKYRTRAVIPKLVDAQRRVASAHGCAFFDTFEAMGGRGTMARWLVAKPALASGDLTHPTPAGAERVGDIFFDALMASFDAHLGRPSESADAQARDAHAGRPSETIDAQAPQSPP